MTQAAATSSNRFRPLTAEDFVREMERLFLPVFTDILQGRGPGHCMRVTDMDPALMLALCRELRRRVPQAQVHLLGSAEGNPAEEGLYVTSTKLVELRNRLEDGVLGPPLLVFLPPNQRASAEDSFGVATFEEIDALPLYAAFADTLLRELPPAFQGYVAAYLQALDSQGWHWANRSAWIRYLLTARINGVDGETLGAALYELGLMPDFKLWENPDYIAGRILRNRECLSALMYSDKSILGRVASLRLTDSDLQRRLGEFLCGLELDRPTQWTRLIVADRSRWNLSFDKWRFEEAILPDRVRVLITGLDLPTASENDADERLQGLIEQRYLAPKQKKSVRVTFEVTPAPARVQGLHHFIVQIVSIGEGSEGESIGVSRRKPTWSGERRTASVTLDRLHQVEFEEGWHVIRVLPYTEGDEQVPLEAWEGAQRPYDSEPFYVLPDVVEAASEVSASRVVPQERSLEHAYTRARFEALQQGRDASAIVPAVVHWAEAGTGRSQSAASEAITVRFEGDVITWQTQVPPILKELERRILAEPRALRPWRLEIRSGSASISEIAAGLEWPEMASLSAFYDARTRYFACISQEEAQLVSQGAFLTGLHTEAQRYAEAYYDLLGDLEEQARRASGADLHQLIPLLRSVLGVDSVRLVIEDHRGRRRAEAALLGPTHPLRALYLAGWTQLAQDWIPEVTDFQNLHSIIREALLTEVGALDMPPLLPLPDGRLLAALESLHPFWSLYVTPGEADPRGLLSEVCAAIGLAEPVADGVGITGDVLAARIGRYLTQHPYVRTLSLNAFNPGSAMVVADALIALQRQEAFADLRYDIRLFVADPETPGVGAAIEQLLSPERGGNREEVDAFARSSGSHLFPKLSLAVRPLRAFQEHPEMHQAHLSLLFDLFQAQEVTVAPPFLYAQSTSPLHGLVQDFVLHYEEDENGIRWLRQPRHGAARPMRGNPILADNIASLAQRVSDTTALAATGQYAASMRPTMRLQLDVEQRTLLHQVHEYSDWVFTLDRYMGIEYFDHGGNRDRPNYLVDYTLSDGVSEAGHKLIITSRSLVEMQALCMRMLHEANLPSSASVATQLMGDLRALSGRLALKLISSASQQYEALGLALARRFLEVEGALTNQLILPLDSHMDLFQTARAQASAENESAATLHRTDLALFDLNESAREITCKLIEVKCYQTLHDDEVEPLRRRIAQQIARSEAVLKHHFDPTEQFPDRPDRLLQTQRLERLLHFYLERGCRYGLLDAPAATEARLLLTTLEASYQLTFKRVALVFNSSQQMSPAALLEDDIEYHWIGAEEMTRLLSQAASGTQERRTALFLAPPRDRSRRSEESLDEQVPQKAASEQEGRSPELQEQDLPIPLLSAPQNDVADTHSRTAPEQEEMVTPYDVLLGANMMSSPQYGLLGEASGKRVALDLNGTQTISLFGVQGSGKSYTLGTILEMACLAIPGVNHLPKPLASILFHYSPTMDYAPEFTSMAQENAEEVQREMLRNRYGAEPRALEDIVLLAPQAQVEARRQEYSAITVEPISFSSSELKSAHWKFLMGAVGSQSLYIRQITQILRQMRNQITLPALLAAIETSELTEHLQTLARTRLNFAAEYIDDTRRLTEVVRPGRLIIVDLRDEFIEKDEALGLFIVLLQLFSEATQAGQPFNKMVVFDEAHKYISNPDLLSGLIEVIREMRHKGTSVLVASQDPMSVPTALIELSSQIILHKMNSPAWLRHIQRANAALGMLQAEKMSQLAAGEAYVWSSAASDVGFTRSGVKIRCRPRVTCHGGSTRTAL